MTIDPACVGCIINQSRRVADAIHADAALRTAIVQSVEAMAPGFAFTQSPPEVATPVYEKMAELASKSDLYDEVKAHSTKVASLLLPELREAIRTSDDRLLSATKVAVAGNVIDLAAEVSFDLHDELEKVFETGFALNDFDRLKGTLEKAQSLLYIGDNAGEHLFDYLYIETLRQLYPALHIIYMVRGRPIINDVTMKEALEAGFDRLCDLVDSGVDTPGFVYGRANAPSRELFDSADLVLTKGMGNYECLSPAPRGNICYLLKVKCQVVANALQAEIGDLVCKLS